MIQVTYFIEISKSQTKIIQKLKSKNDNIKK